MLSFQEMVQKTEDQRRRLKRYMDSGGFHPEECSIFHNLKPADYYELKSAYDRYSLSEFLAKSGTLGIAGAIYLVPDKLHSTMIAASYQSDKVPLFSAQVVNGWKGGDLKVDIAVRQSVGGEKAEGGKWSMYPHRFDSGGTMAVQTVETVQATISPISFSVPFVIAEDLIDSAAFDLVEFHTKHAAQQLGQYATDLAIADLKAASDGDGTQATVTATADSTTTDELLEGLREVGNEFWNPNTMIVTYEAWGDDIVGTAGHPGIVIQPAPQGYDLKFQCLDTIFNNSCNLATDVTSGKMTDCVTLILDRSAALLCGRKRWMKIENYANPVADLGGAVISCRQDCVTLYKDASCEITEQ